MQTTYASAEIQQRYDFAHRLRAVAALSVVMSHFIGVFWAANPDIMDLLSLPRIPHLPPLDPILSRIVSLRLVFGMFGVGVFFVLSGFVITFSVLRESRRTFLNRRILRIYPTYIVGFLVVMAALHLACTLAGTTFGFSGAHIAVHTLLLLRGPLDFPRIDGISWTLEVELIFYLVMLLVGRNLVELGLVGLALASAAILSICVPLIYFRYAGGFVGVQASCGLMLVAGIAYALHAVGRVDARQLALAQCSIAAVLVAVWLLINNRLHMPLQWLVGYLMGMAVFGICNWLWRDTPSKSRNLLDHFADISYPLYVVHGLLGYAVMYWTVTHTGSAYLAIIAAFAVAYTVALALHKLIEKPTIQWSRALQFHARAEHAGH